MLQDNSFFYFPMTYFGSYQHFEEEVESEEEELNFADLLQISSDAHFAQLPQKRIGLFIHWCDVRDLLN